MRTSENEGKVLKVIQNIYGQVQASRVWNLYLVEKLKSIGFVQSEYDECIFYKGNAVYTLYTDDSILAGPDQKELEDIYALWRYIGWVMGVPEHLLVIRRDSAVLYAEGDPVHFGTLYLDRDHSVMRTGYRYLEEAGVEVALELTLRAAGTETALMLGPGERAQCGAYLIEHERSYDPSDRPSAVPHHAYSFRVARTVASGPPPPHPGDVPSPIDIEAPGPVLAAARARGELRGDEALLAEPEAFAARLSQYEGPQAALEDALREHGPWPAEFRRLGELIEVESPRLSRGPGGVAVIGRARVRLFPTGDFEIDRVDASTLPGRMRKAASE